MLLQCFLQWLQSVLNAANALNDFRISIVARLQRSIELWTVLRNWWICTRWHLWLLIQGHWLVVDLSCVGIHHHHGFALRRRGSLHCRIKRHLRIESHWKLSIWCNVILWTECVRWVIDSMRPI